MKPGISVRVPGRRRGRPAFGGCIPVVLASLFSACGLDGPVSVSGREPAAYSLEDVSPTPAACENDVAVTEGSWTRSCGGWRSGSAITNGAADPGLQCLLQSVSSSVMTANCNSSVSGWAFSVLPWEVLDPTTGECGGAGATPVNRRIANCSEGFAALCDRIPGTRDCGAGEEDGVVVSIKEEASEFAGADGCNARDQQSRLISRPIALGDGQYKLSLDTLCETSDGQSCDSIVGSRGGSQVWIQVQCRGIVPYCVLGELPAADVLSAPVPNADNPTRFEAEIYIPGGCNAIDEHAAISIFAYQDLDMIKKTSELPDDPYNAIQIDTADNPWRQMVLKNLRFEKVSIPQTETEIGLKDYFRLMEYVSYEGETAESPKRACSNAMGDSSRAVYVPATPANAVKKTCMPGDPSGCTSQSAGAASVTFVEIDHPPSTILPAEAEQGTGMSFFISSRPEEVRPWTRPEPATSVHPSATDPLIISDVWVGDESGDASAGDIPGANYVRQWIHVHNAGSQVLNPLFTYVMPSGYENLPSARLYAVVQGPVTVPARRDSAAPANLTVLADGSSQAVFKIQPTFLTECTQSDGEGHFECGRPQVPNDVCQTGETTWPIDPGATRSYVMEIPKEWKAVQDALDADPNQSSFRWELWVGATDVPVAHDYLPFRLAGDTVSRGEVTSGMAHVLVWPWGLTSSDMLSNLPVYLDRMYQHGATDFIVKAKVSRTETEAWEVPPAGYLDTMQQAMPSSPNVSVSFDADFMGLAGDGISFEATPVKPTPPPGEETPSGYVYYVLRPDGSTWTYDGVQHLSSPTLALSNAVRPGDYLACGTDVTKLARVGAVVDGSGSSEVYLDVPFKDGACEPGSTPTSFTFHKVRPEDNSVDLQLLTAWGGQSAPYYEQSEYCPTLRGVFEESACEGSQAAAIVISWQCNGDIPATAPQGACIVDGDQWTACVSDIPDEVCVDECGQTDGVCNGTVAQNWCSDITNRRLEPLSGPSEELSAIPYPIQCQRPMVQVRSAGTPGVYERLACFPYDAVATSTLAPEGRCWTRYELNHAQEDEVDLIADAYQNSLDSLNGESTGVVVMDVSSYDESKHWGYGVQPFNGFGAAHLLGVMDRFEALGVSTVISAPPDLMALEYNHNTGLFDSIRDEPNVPYLLPPSYLYPMGHFSRYSEYSQALVSDYLYNQWDWARELFYDGGFNWATKSPFEARMVAGLGGWRVRELTGRELGFILWPVSYGVTHDTTSFVTYRDWLRFTKVDGKPTFGEVNPSLLLPCAGNDPINAPPTCNDETLGWAMVQEGVRDARMATHLGGTIQSTVAGLVPFEHGIYPAKPESTCTTSYLALGGGAGTTPDSPTAACGDYLCFRDADCAGLDVDGYAYHCDLTSWTCEGDATP